MNFIKVIFIIGLWPISFSSMAKDICTVNSAVDFLERIKANHPEVLINQASLEAITQETEIASQRLNPELGLEGARGDESDGKISRANISLLQPIELGGKRGARKRYAKSLSEQAQFQLQDQNEDIVIDTIIKAYRLRQVQEIIPLYEEAHRNFERIYQMKRDQRALSPEEQVELETLTLAANDYKLKFSMLKAEEFNLRKHLSLFMGADCRLQSSALPKRILLNRDFSTDTTFSSYARLQDAVKSVEAAEDRLALEEAKSYPDLKLGPVFEIERINGKNYQTIGLALSMELPLWNSNRAARTQSRMEMRREAIRLQFQEREASLDLKAWIEKYNSLRQAMKQAAKPDEVSKKHAKIEELFRRGVISTAMVIESQRQLIEFRNTYDEFELGVAEALWNIHKINGTVFSETL